MRRPASTHLAAGVLLAAALLAGCSGEDAPDGEATPTTTSPSPTPTETPTPQESPSQEGVGVGEVVEGFPTDVVPVLPEAEITLSTVVPADGVRQVSLAGTTDVPPDQVMTFYRDALVGQGFTETPSAVPEGVLGSTFTRGDATELLTVTVTTVEGAQQFTVGGQLAG